MSYRLLVFDLDGTLVDSEQDLADAVNATLASFGRAPLPINTIRGYVGNGAAALLSRAFAESRAPEVNHDAALRFFLTHYRAHKLDHTCLYPGVLDTLHALQRRLPRALMAVLTNKPVRPSREICDGLGIGSFFFQIYGGESFPTKKPDPMGLLALLSEASVRLEAAGEPPLRSSEAMMIGDSPIDIATARAAGTDAVGCTFGLGEPEAVRLAQPTYIAEQPSDWLRLASGSLAPLGR